MGRCSYIHGDVASCLQYLTRPVQWQCSVTTVRRACMFITNPETSQKQYSKLNFSSFPVQDRNPVCSVLLSLKTLVLPLVFFQMLPTLLPFKCYPFGEDYSHPNLNNMEVNDVYTASWASKAPQGVEPCKIRRVRNKTTLRNSWLNVKIWGFFNHDRRHSTSWGISTLNTFQEEESPV